ncbi:MAG: 3-phosphoserine/phosphohydroxythreonine transaminase [Erysipelotrichia bacterium]|nr:3-phosphoserine/phosphohydroxythreonine transaminase [Erysipelotrichia bacterium]
MSRVLNFSAGPSQMPKWVLEKAAAQMLEYGDSGQSVMEMSHRSKDFMAIIQDCEKRLRELMDIPDNYKVLFLQGGASLQFTMIPLNLLGKYKKAGLINTGAWSKKAMKELKKIGECVLVANSEDKNYTYIPKEYEIPNDIDYFYICENNTIYGTKYKTLPDTKDIPLVADMSSCILSEPVDVSKYGLIFAGAQKNMGPAGLTVVIIREDLLKETPANLPTMLDYKTHVEAGSMFNTPPTYAIYMCDLMLTWLQEEIGGLKAMQKINQQKAAMLYEYLDQSTMFKGTVEKEDRSLMNIPFVSNDADLDAKFIKEAQKAGFVNIKGHRSVGGMRASIYNAMSLEGVAKLVDFMKTFERENG